MNITNLHFYVPIIEDIQKPKLIPDLMPFSPSAFQLYASIFIGGFTGLNVGAVLGFSAILLPQLPREITLSDKSWLASICNLGQLVGALLGQIFLRIWLKSKTQIVSSQSSHFQKETIFLIIRSEQKFIVSPRSCYFVKSQFFLKWTQSQSESVESLKFIEKSDHSRIYQ